MPSPQDLLGEVAAGARLAEGPEGVRRILRTVFLEGAIPIRDLAQDVGLPVPVVAAVRGELEKRKIFKRDGGVCLTEDGQAVVTDLLGLSCRRRFPGPLYPNVPADLETVLHRMEAICEGRPRVEVRLDQSHALAETALRRAIYLYGNDALEGRDVLILGDDDLTSVAIGLLAGFLNLRIRRIVVLEFDRRLVAFLKAASGEFGTELDVITHDLRQEIPAELTRQFDVFLTDPPYTPEGLNLFVSRGVAALRPVVGKQVFVCFGPRVPAETAAAVGALIEMGLAPMEILPNFNRYVGAQVLGGVSQMIRLIVTRPNLTPRVMGTYQGALYTADRKRARRSDGR